MIEDMLPIIKCLFQVYSFDEIFSDHNNVLFIRQ